MGPFEFSNLDKNTFDGQKAQQKVIKYLGSRGDQKHPSEQQKRLAFLNKICAHGYRVMVKARSVKRGSSLLKHARFLNNLTVEPKLPPVKEV